MAKHIYTTKGLMSLGNQVSLSNKNSNVDIDYGPYVDYTLDEIKEHLQATLQIGKTVGVIENGKVVEYWAQAVDGDVNNLQFVKKIDVDASQIGDVYSKTEIDNKFDKLATAFKYKGTVASESDLPTASETELGNVYTITEYNNAEYLCTRKGSDDNYTYSWIIVGYDEMLTNEEIDEMFK